MRSARLLSSRCVRCSALVGAAYQVVGPNAHVIRAATMFVVVGTTFLFGGSTKCLLDALKIPTGCQDPGEEEEELPTSSAPKGALTRMGTVKLALEEMLVDRREDAFTKLHGYNAHEA